MAVASAVLVALEVVQNERVQKAAARLWERTPWGRSDSKKKEADARVIELTSDVREIAGSVALVSMDDAVTRRFEKFQRQLVELGTPEKEAKEMAAVVRRDIDLTILNPVRELRGLQERLEAAETAAQSASARLDVAEGRLTRLQGLGAIAVAFSIVAFVLALIVVVRG